MCSTYVLHVHVQVYLIPDTEHLYFIRLFRGTFCEYSVSKIERQLFLNPQRPNLLYCHLDFAIMCAIVGDMIFPSCYVCFPCPCKRNTILQKITSLQSCYTSTSSGLTYLNPPPPPNRIAQINIFIFMFTFTHNSQVKM